MDTSAHTPITYTPINCDQSTYFCLQISGQVRRSLYTGALCEGDRFTSIGHPDTPARWTHTHIHTNRHQPIGYTKTHTHTHIHMYSHSNIHSLAYTPVRWTHTHIQCNMHTQTHVNTNTCTITQILINSLVLLGFHKVVKNTLHWLVFWFASVANCE